MQWPQAFQDKVYMGLKSIEESVKLSSRGSTAGSMIITWIQTTLDTAVEPRYDE